MKSSIFKGIYSAMPKSEHQDPKITKTQELQNQLHGNVAHTCILLVQITVNQDRALMPNGQGTEGTLTTVQQLMLGLGEIGVKKKKN